MLLHTLVSNSLQTLSKDIAVCYDDGEISQSKTYSQLRKDVQEISSHLSSMEITEKTVAVILSPSVDIPAVLLGILFNSCCYFPLAIDNGKKFILESIKRSGAIYIIHDSSMKEDLTYCVEELNGKYVEGFNLDRFLISLVRLELESDICSLRTSMRHHPNNPTNDHNRTAYCITTSGTTGHPKVIRVPHSCIVPNIIDFSKIFQVDKKDVILLTAPLTFDPSVVDIFLALCNGAKVVIVPDYVKKDPRKLVNILHSRQNVTVIQATPSLIRRCSAEMLQQTILGPNSSLRVLALGGEAFPSLSELQRWVHPLNKTTVYNIYGITEVSCWATYELIDVHHIIESNDVVSIGKPLSGTMICVDAGKESHKEHEICGHICIGSSERVCIVEDSEDSHPQHPVINDSSSGGSVVWRDTGDIGKVLDDGRIVFVGREDDQIKRHGKRMTLSALESVCGQSPWISKCCALVTEENQLVIFYVSRNVATISNASRVGVNGINVENENKQTSIMKIEIAEDSFGDSEDTFAAKVSPSIGNECPNSGMEESTLRAHIADSLPSHYNPDKILKLEYFPITTHGKLDKKRLFEMAKVNVLSIEMIQESPTKSLSHIWKTYLPKATDEIDMRDSFVSLGGDSLAAVNLVNHMENILDYSLPVDFMDTLLNKTFGDCVKILQTYLEVDEHFITMESINNEASNGIERKEGSNVTGLEEHKDHLIESNDVADPHKGRPEQSHSFSVFKNEMNCFKKSPKYLLCSGQDKNCAKVDLWKLGVFSRGNRVTNVCGKHQSNSVLTKDVNMFKDDQQQQQFLDCEDIQNVYMNSGNVSGVQRDPDKSCGSLHPSDSVRTMPSTKSTVENAYCRKRAKEKGNKRSSHFNDSKGSSSVTQEENREFLSDEQPLGLDLRWTVDTRKCVDASPVIVAFSPVKHLVFIGSHSGNFTAVDLDSGKKLWTTALPDRIESSACVTKNMKNVIVGCYNGSIYTMGIETGNVEWEFPTRSCVKCSPCLDEGTGHVICGSHDGWMYCLDTEKKVSPWKQYLGGGSIYSSPVVDSSSNLIFAATLTGKLFAFNNADGCPVWCLDLKKPLFSSPCLHQGSFVMIGCVDSHLYCVDCKLGRVEWKFNTHGPVFSSPVSHGGFIFVGSHSCQFFCLTSEGQLLWTFQTPSPIFSTPYVFSSHASYPSNIYHHPQVQGSSLENRTDIEGGEPIIKIPRIDDQEKDNETDFSSQPCNYSSHSVNAFTGKMQTIGSDVCVCNHLLSIDRKCLDLSCTVNKNSSIANNVSSNARVVSEEKTLVLFASTKGTLHILESESGHQLTSTHLRGEVFSSPVFYNGNIVVGCRDDLLYCFDLCVRLNQPQIY